MIDCSNSFSYFVLLSSYLNPFHAFRKGSWIWNIFGLGCYIFVLHWLLYFYKGSHLVVYGKLPLRIAFLYLRVCFWSTGSRYWIASGKVSRWIWYFYWFTVIFLMLWDILFKFAIIYMYLFYNISLYISFLSV